MWSSRICAYHARQGNLLRERQFSQPRAVRNLLLGHFDEASMLKMAGTACRFLAGPSDVDALKSVLQRAPTLRALVDDERQLV